MKKVLTFVLILVIALGILWVVSIGSVKDEPFVNSAYFKKTMLRVDSLKRTETAISDSVLAGFSKVSITPTIHNMTDDPTTGKFIAVPLAGFGARKGKPATGVHAVSYTHLRAHETDSYLVCR